MNVSRLAFILASLFLSSSSYAFDPPKVVYRVSSRAPADVFSSGFPAAGNDIDLMRYVSGTSVVDGTSTYISTTEIPRDALAIAAIFAQAYPSIPVYIYLVRPTENFYSVAASLRFAQDALPSPEVREQAIAISLATQGQENGHWAARGGITSEQILGVRRFFYNDGYPVLRDLIRNNNYLYMPATISHLPMPAHNAKVVAAYVAEKTLGAGFMFAATVNMGCDQQARQCRKAFASHCLAVKPISFKTLLSTTVAEMISAGILINSTSRQLWSEPVHDEL